MPALNMASPYVPAANPSGGEPVSMSPFSGPKGSPFDASMFHPTTGVKSKDPNNFSTGALNTGIGMAISSPATNSPSPASIRAAGFTDDYTPGLTLPNGTAAPDARLTCIGGGRSNIVGGGATGLGLSTPAPYSAVPICAFGNGASRDGGAGPAFTGFAMKMVTAAAPVATGAAIEAGFTNRVLSVAQTGYPGSDPVGQTLAIGQSAFGSATAASVGPTLLEEEPEEEEEEEEEEP